MTHDEPSLRNKHYLAAERLLSEADAAVVSRRTILLQEAQVRATLAQTLVLEDLRKVVSELRRGLTT